MLSTETGKYFFLLSKNVLHSRKQFNNQFEHFIMIIMNVINIIQYVWM